MIPIYSILSNAAPVVSIVSNRIYRNEAPQGTSDPYVVWEIQAGFAENGFKEVSADVFSVEVSVWAKTQATCDQLAIAVRNAIEPHAHLITYTNDSIDTPTKLKGFRMSFDWILSR